jgi:hypothetical protein
MRRAPSHDRGAPRSAADGNILCRSRLALRTGKEGERRMTSLLKVTAIAAALMLPPAIANAQPQQGSNEAQGYAQSHSAAGAGYGSAYARYHRGHHRGY